MNLDLPLLLLLFVRLFYRVQLHFQLTVITVYTLHIFVYECIDDAGCFPDISSWSLFLSFPLFIYRAFYPLNFIIGKSSAQKYSKCHDFNDEDDVGFACVHTHIFKEWQCSLSYTKHTYIHIVDGKSSRSTIFSEHSFLYTNTHAYILSRYLSFFYHLANS